MTPPDHAFTHPERKTGPLDGQVEQPHDEPNTKPESLMSKSAAKQNGTDRPTRAQVLAEAASVPAERRTWLIALLDTLMNGLRFVRSALWTLANPERARMLALVTEAFDGTAPTRAHGRRLPSDPDALDMLLFVAQSDERLRQQRQGDVEDLARGVGYPLDEPAAGAPHAPDES